MGTLRKRLECRDEAENFGVFHMADFVARKEQFAATEWDE
jgi:hypothetical protein